VLDAISVDTTITGFPSIGDENFLLLANRGDTLDTRVIVRYDSIPSTYLLTTAGADSTIRTVDSAAVRLVVDTAHGRTTVPVTIEAYDMGDSTVADTSAAALLALFTPDRLIGSKSFAPESLVDSVRIPISNEVVLSRVTHKQPLRVGLRLRSATPAAVRFTGSGLTSSGAEALRFRVSRDTSVAAISVDPNSRTPSDSALAFLKAALADYVIIAKGPPPPPPGTFGVGGLPGARAYVRFEIPTQIIDSTRIVRATLQLTQVPNAQSPAAGDSLWIQPLSLLSGVAVTDLATALRLASAPGTYGLDSTHVVPRGSGTIEVQLVPLVQQWSFYPKNPAPHAIALRSNLEGVSGGQVLFYSITASPSLRPRLRLTYVPHVTFGLP
jgi:hypothetical protein